MGSQQLCLKWNNHQSNLIDVFDELLENESFVDVTLACEGSSLKAHKVVLSACSPFFKSLLKDNPCKHPIIIMKDLQYHQLKCILQFMYKGEVSICKEELSSLLQAAEALKVKGLTEVQRNQHHSDSPTTNSGENHYENPTASLIPHKKKRKRPNDEVQHVEPKSKLESTLLGELESNYPTKALHESVHNDMNSNYSLDPHNITDYSRNSISSDHGMQHVTADVDPSHHDPTGRLSPNSNPHSLNSEQAAQDMDEEVEEIEHKLPISSFVHNSNEDHRLKPSIDNDNSPEPAYKLTADDSQDVTAAAIATQDGNKPEYRRQCHICNKVLKSAQINRHIRAIHMNARFECEFCPATYNDRSNLKRHVKTAHLALGTQNFENSLSKQDTDNNNIPDITETSIIKSEESSSSSS